MKTIWIWLKKTVVRFFKWIWSECKDKKTLALLGVVSLILSLPIWLGYLLGFIFGWDWAIWAATAVWGFWLLPGAPFFVVAVAITLGIKKLYQRLKKRKKENTQP